MLNNIDEAMQNLKAAFKMNPLNIRAKSMIEYIENIKEQQNK